MALPMILTPSMIGNSSQQLWARAIILASMVDIAVSDFNLDHHIIGQLALSGALIGMIDSSYSSGWAALFPPSGTKTWCGWSEVSLSLSVCLIKFGSGSDRSSGLSIYFTCLQSSERQWRSSGSQQQAWHSGSLSETSPRGGIWWTKGSSEMNSSSWKTCLDQSQRGNCKYHQSRYHCQHYTQSQTSCQRLSDTAVKHNQ